MPPSPSLPAPDPDRLRALARSSPWLWRSLHLRRTKATGEAVEAWVRRPGWMRLVDDRGERVETGLPYSTSTITLPSGGSPGRSGPRTPVLPHTVDPVLRPDGLVAERPPADYGDPFHENYRWVAMLDPAELGSGVEVARLRDHVREGRRTWTAELRAVPGYEPRCGGGCCELLPSAAGWYAERDEEPPRAFPEHHLVSLDVRTGVVVELRTPGGDPEDFGVEVFAVDDPGIGPAPLSA